MVFFFHCYVLDPMFSVFLQCQCVIAASGYSLKNRIYDISYRTGVTSGTGTAYTFISHCCLPAFCGCSFFSFLWNALFFHFYVLDPMFSVFLQCQCLIAASGFQFEDSKVVIRGFKSHDRQYSLSALLKRLHVFLVWILYFYQQDVCFYIQIKLSWQIWAPILLCICYWYIWYFIYWLYRLICYIEVLFKAGLTILR
jgi:hypothetical protein